MRISLRKFRIFVIFPLAGFLIFSFYDNIKKSGEPDFYTENGKKIYYRLSAGYEGRVIETPLALTQEDDLSCGVAVIHYLLHQFGFKISQKEIKNEMDFSRKKTTSFLDMKNIFEKRGFQVRAEKVKYSELKEHLENWNIIAHFSSGHFVVVQEKTEGDFLSIFDPEVGRVKIKKSTFINLWSGLILKVKKE